MHERHFLTMKSAYILKLSHPLLLYQYILFWNVYTDWYEHIRWSIHAHNIHHFIDLIYKGLFKTHDRCQG